MCHTEVVWGHFKIHYQAQKAQIQCSTFCVSYSGYTSVCRSWTDHLIRWGKKSTRTKNATRCVNIMECSLTRFISHTTATHWLHLLTIRQTGNHNEATVWGCADISVNSCTAHTDTVIIVEVTSWEEERANSQFWVCEEAKGKHKCVLISWLQIILEIFISFLDMWVKLSLLLYLFNAEALREAKRSGNIKTWLQSVTHSLFLTSLQCHPPSQSAQAHTLWHSHTPHTPAPCSHSKVALDVLALQSFFWRPLRTVACQLCHCHPTRQAALQKKKLSHILNCDSPPQGAQPAGSISKQWETQKHRRKLEHT